MASQHKAFWVGAFVITGVGLAVLALVWFGASNWFAATQMYVTYFDSSVQGLNEDAEVKFRGVEVGQVSRIRVAPDGNLVEVVLELDQDFIVTDRMRAHLRYAGITGMRYVEIDYADTGRPDTFTELSFEAPHPVIRSQPGGFEQIEASLKEVAERVLALDTEAISVRAQEFLETGTSAFTAADSLLRSPELGASITRLARTTERLEQMVSALDGERYDAKIDTILTQFEEGSRRLNRMAAGLEGEIDSMDLSARTDSLFLSLNELVNYGRELINRSQYATTETMTRFGLTLDQLDAVLEQLNAVLLSLESYPSNVLYTAPPAKEK
ncbi:MAG: MCE family protein [Candidatus Eisenbacteria bacterium]|nr:MCE family protein [Candidatus Latescibacterota bacterium]MBD3303412.1 MCE family protein [Candidatus Eisenbacteria bacterium]